MGVQEYIIYQKDEKVTVKGLLLSKPTDLQLGEIVEFSNMYQKSAKVKIGAVIQTVDKSKLAMVTVKTVGTVQHMYYAKGQSVFVKGLNPTYPLLEQIGEVLFASTLSEEVAKVRIGVIDYTVAKTKLRKRIAAVATGYFAKDTPVKVEKFPDGKTDITAYGVTSEFSTYNEKVVMVVIKGENYKIAKEYVSKCEAPRTKFITLKEVTDDEKYMAELFQAKTHEEVVTLGIEGLDISKYTMIKAKKYTVFIPNTLKEGELIPCLMAHTDLHPALTHPTKENLEYEGGIFSSPTGLGADDRAGIFSINKVIRSHPGKFMILFPDEEEIGCVGSNAFALAKSYQDMDKIASMYVSIDRRREHSGGKSIATYSYDDNVLNAHITKTTGRKAIRGSSTDCRVLSQASTRKVPCFNLSCGYVGEHTKGEKLYFKELIETVKDLQIILEDENSYKAHKVTTYKTTKVTTTTKNKNKTTSHTSYGGFECIEYDGEWYMEEDLIVLLDTYKFFNGAAYDPKNPYLIGELDVNDLATVDNEMTVGKKYGGEVYSANLAKVLKAYTWEVATVDEHGKYSLTSIDGKRTCTHIPRCWLIPILEGDPLINIEGN